LKHTGLAGFRLIGKPIVVFVAPLGLPQHLIFVGTLISLMAIVTLSVTLN